MERVCACVAGRGGKGGLRGHRQWRGPLLERCDAAVRDVLAIWVKAHLHAEPPAWGTQSPHSLAPANSLRHSAQPTAAGASSTSSPRLQLLLARGARVLRWLGARWALTWCMCALPHVNTRPSRASATVCAAPHSTAASAATGATARAPHARAEADHASCPSSRKNLSSESQAQSESAASSSSHESEVGGEGGRARRVPAARSRTWARTGASMSCRGRDGWDRA